MMLVLCVVVAVGLLSLGEAAPLSNTCQDMMTPLQLTGPDLFLGKWMFVGESTEIPWSRWLTNTFIVGGWVEVTKGPSNTTLDALQIQRMGEEDCYSFRYNMSFDKNTFTVGEPYQSTWNLYRTCPDCLLIKDSTTFHEKTFVSLHLMSKRRELTADELDTFKEQAKCLNLKPPTIMDPKIDLEKCQNATLRQDISDFFQSEAGKEVKEFIDKLQAMDSFEFISFIWNNLFG